jgi:hypothetical protein
LCDGRNGEAWAEISTCLAVCSSQFCICLGHKALKQKYWLPSLFHRIQFSRHEIAVQVGESIFRIASQRCTNGTATLIHFWRSFLALLFLVFFPFRFFSVAKDPRFERLVCDHKGTYADDCLVQRVTEVKGRENWDGEKTICNFRAALCLCFHFTLLSVFCFSILFLLISTFFLDWLSWTF